MLYFIALESFLRKLKTNSILRGISLPGDTTSARYSVYADDKVGKEIRGYATVTCVNINRDKSVGLQLAAWKGVSFPVSFLWMDGRTGQDVLFGPDMLL